MPRKTLIFTLFAIGVGFLLFWFTSVSRVDAGSGGGVTNYTLTVNFSGGGSVKLNPPNQTYTSTVVRTYPQGTVVALLANNVGNWEFDHWEGHLSGDSASQSITMNSHKAVTAVFKHPQLTVLKEGEGDVHIDPPDETQTPTFTELYDPETLVTVTAIPDEGWRFTHWEDEAGATLSEEIEYDVLVEDQEVVRAVFSDEIDITVKFATQGYMPELYVVPTPSAVVSSGNQTVYTVPYDESIAFSIPSLQRVNEDTRRAFHRWTSPGETFSGSTELGIVIDATAEKDVVVGATVYYGVGGLSGLWFSQLTYPNPEDLLVQMTNVVPKGGIYNFKAGTPVEIMPKDYPGYSFYRWHLSGTGTGTTSTAVPLRLEMDRDWWVTPEYTTGKRLTISNLSNGSITASATGYSDYTFEPGPSTEYTTFATSTEVTLTADPDTGYNFYSWRPSVGLAAGQAHTEPLVFELIQDVSLEPLFTLPAVVESVSVIAGHRIDVTFSLVMSAAALDPAKYTLSGTGKGTLANNPAAVTDLGEGVYSLTWTSGNMVTNGDITITVDSAVKDAAGNDMGATRSGTDVGGGISDGLAPVAAFSVAPTSGTAPLTVQFTDESVPGTSAITSWSWNFGDGSGAGTTQNPSHTYTADGVYTVALTVTSADGSDTETREGIIEVGDADSSISVSPNILQFGYVPAGQSKQIVLKIENNGEGLLAGTANVEAPFGIVDDASYAIQPGMHDFLTVSYTPTTAEASEDVIGLVGGGNELVSVYGSSVTPQTGATTGVRLNELVVWNTSGVKSANGEYVDWIELYNETTNALDLGGWTLTDDAMDTDKYTIPAGTVIAPEGYLLIFASDDPSPPPGELHTGFTLDEANGGYLGLFAPSAGTAVSDVEYPETTDDTSSYSLLEDELKIDVDWEFGVPTRNLQNYGRRWWPFIVYGSTQIVQGEVPDPTIPYNQHTGLDPAEYVDLDQWLTKVQAQTLNIFGNQSGQTIVSPMNAPASVSIAPCTVPYVPAQCGDRPVHAGVVFTMATTPRISNMPNALSSMLDLYKTMHNVVDGSLVVVGTLDTRTNPQSASSAAFGHTVVSTDKKVIFVAAEAMDQVIRGKWHSSVFVHELAHYAGLGGHPVSGFTEWYDEKIILWTLTSPQTNEYEPWFLVVANQTMKVAYEGVLWGTQAQRRHPRKFVIGLDGIPGDVMAVNDAAIALQTPW